MILGQYDNRSLSIQLNLNDIDIIPSPRLERIFRDHMDMISLCSSFRVLGLLLSMFCKPDQIRNVLTCDGHPKSQLQKGLPPTTLT